ncbi:MAG: GntR family transcriptional regulator [Planctomycetota bacterium]|jgi:DNA-binding LacI/PurR family transcriptional regulator
MSTPQPVHRLRRRQHARERLEQLIRDGKLRGRRLPGERELAEQLGVCRVTLRRALAQLEREGRLERRHGSGTFVSEAPPRRGRRRSARVAVLGPVHYEDLPGWDLRGEMVLGMRRQAPRSAAEVSVLAADRAEEAEIVADPSELRRFDAFVCMGDEDPELIDRLVALDRGPVVVLDGYVRGLPVTMVVDSGMQGMREVTRHLLALGHRRIAFIDCFEREALNPEKFAGYRAALLEKGIATDESLVAVPDRPDGLYDGPEIGRYDVESFVGRAVENFMKLPDPPTAIIGFDDGRALPAARFLEERGLRVGTDFSVAGFGDQAARRGWADWLTSSRIYPRKMGREALKAAIERAGKPPREARTVFVPTRLQIRKSTCPPAQPKRRS